MSNHADRARARAAAGEVLTASAVVSVSAIRTNPGILRDTMFDGVSELAGQLGFSLVAGTEPTPLGEVKVTVALVPLGVAAEKRASE